MAKTELSATRKAYEDGLVLVSMILGMAIALAGVFFTFFIAYHLYCYNAAGQLPERRYEIAQQMLDDLFQYLQRCCRRRPSHPKHREEIDLEAQEPAATPPPAVSNNPSPVSTRSWWSKNSSPVRASATTTSSSSDSSRDRPSASPSFTPGEMDIADQPMRWPLCDDSDEVTNESRSTTSAESSDNDSIVSPLSELRRDIRRTRAASSLSKRTSAPAIQRGALNRRRLRPTSWYLSRGQFLPLQQLRRGRDTRRRHNMFAQRRMRFF